MSEKNKTTDNVATEQYKIKIVDTYIDKNTGYLAKNFGKILIVPKDISEEKAKELIKAKVAKVVKDDGLETKTDKESENKAQ